jgi:membrane protein DedA with SNARE-associated domain
MFDALLPPIPSDELMAAIASLAASDSTPSLLWVVPITGLGAFIGDILSYSVGRAGGPAVLRKWEHKSAVAKSYEWAQKNIERRGWLFILVARYIPFGRLTTMLACGGLRYSFARFCALDALSVSICVTIGGLISYGGGTLFVDAPLIGAVTAVLLVTSVSLIRFGYRFLRRFLKQGSLKSPQEVAALTFGQDMASSESSAMDIDLEPATAP